MKIRFLIGSFVLQLAIPLLGAVGQQVWTIPFTLVAAPGVRVDGSVAAQSNDTLLLVSSDGTERWRRAVRASTSNSAQPPLIDDDGNIIVLTSTGVSSYRADGALAWSFAVTSPTVYTSLALGQNGQIVVKNGDDWYALDATGHTLWTRSTSGSGGMVDPSSPHYSASPAIVASDGKIRSANSADLVEIRSIEDGSVLAGDRLTGDVAPFANSALLGIGPSGESLVLAARQAPPLNPAVAYLATPSAGNFRVRWSETSGIGQSWTNAFVLGNPNNGPLISERALYALCAPDGEVLVATSQGTVIMPHDGIGSRRWNDTAFAVADNGDVLCYNGSQIVVRHANQSLAWSAAAEGTFFTLGPSGRVYGGTQSLSAYDVGLTTAAGPWAQPRGNARQNARAPQTFGPFIPSIASTIDATSTQTLYDSYAGQVSALPYVQGPGTATWEKDGTEVGAAADDYSLVIPSASAATAGNYRLRIDTARGAVRSAPIAVGVVPPSSVRAGLYWGKLPAPNNALYCLEIKADRTVRYLTSDGQHFTTAMNVRLDPSGTYPWSLPIPQYDQNVTLHADGSGVTVSWQNGTAQSATPAAGALASGARTGWYDGNYVGPLNDDCTTGLALLPDGTLIGKIKGITAGVVLPITLDSQALSQTVLVNGTSSSIADQLTVTLNTVGRATFELRSFPYARATPVRFEAFAPGTAPATRLINLSARSHAGVTTGTLIAGFVVADPGAFLVRGVGPTLSQFGVSTPLATPTLRLTKANGTLLGENRGWSTLDTAGKTLLVDAATQAGAFPLRDGSADAALVAQLDAGGYTALISSADEGEALAELYVMPPPSGQSASRLVNLSARGRLTAASPMLTIGFVHVTDAARRILIRGVGPSLKPFVGDATVCANPRLRVYNGDNALITGNNDWPTYGTSPATLGTYQTQTVTDAAASSGAFPLIYGSHDAAVVLNLAGGQYTVQLDSEDGSTGEVLFEVYAVP